MKLTCELTNVHISLIIIQTFSFHKLKFPFSFRTNLMKLRSQYKDAFFEKHGVKLGLMSGFIKVRLKKFPELINLSKLHR